MYEKLTSDQWFVIQGFYVANAVAAGYPLTPVFMARRCKNCENCSECCPKSFKAPTPCLICGRPIHFDMSRTGACINPECIRIAEFYGIKTRAWWSVANTETDFATYTDSKNLMGKMYQQRRRDTASFFKEDGLSQCFYNLTFEELKLGVLLESRRDINLAIKHLKEIK